MDQKTLGVYYEHPEWFEKFFNKLEIEWDPNKNLRYNMMSFDLKFYLTDDLLVKTDRASMANSLEVRAPFLDFEVLLQTYLP